MSHAIDMDRERLAEFCKKWKITEFALFGSVTGDQFGEDSDIDVMVTFEQGVEWGLDFMRMKWELEDLFQRDVDVFTREGVEQSHNAHRRERILKSSKIIYRVGN